MESPEERPPQVWYQGGNDEISRLKAQFAEIHSIVKQIQSTQQSGPSTVAPASSLPATSPSDTPDASRQTEPNWAFTPSILKSQHGASSSSDGPVIGHLGRLVSLGDETEFFAGSTTGVHFIRSVELRWQKLGAKSQSFPDSFFFIHLLPQPTSLYAPTSNTNLITLSMTKDYYFARLDRFLLRWGRLWPVLCKRQALEAFGSAIDCLQSDRPLAKRTTDLYQLLLVLAIDAWDNVEDDSAVQYYQLAMTIEFQSLIICSLRSVQALILKSILYQLQGRHSEVMPTIGAAVRSAQTIGLHRHPRRFRVCAGEMEFRTRLWWCIMVLDITSSINYGLPKLINDTDVDVPFPTECDLEDMTMDQLPVPMPGEDTKMTTFITYARLVSILHQITKLLFTTTERRDGEMKIQQLDRQLRVWQHAVVRGKQDDHLSQYLQILGHFCGLLIHQPGLTFDEQIPQFRESLNASTRCALTLLTLLNHIRTERRLLYMQPSGARIAFQSALICLFYAWTHKTDQFDGESLSAAIELAVNLLEQQNQELHDENLSQLLQTLTTLHVETVQFVDRSSAASVSEADQTMPSDDLSNWPSSLWQFNDADITEWSDGFGNDLQNNFVFDSNLV